LTNKIQLDNGKWKLEDSPTCEGDSCQKLPMKNETSNESDSEYVFNK
jgi:hypothetical protein